MIRTISLAASASVLLLAIRAEAEDGGVGDGGLADDSGSGSCPADAVGCSEAVASWSWSEGFLDEIEIDTGWIPPGSPLQLRFGLFLGGMTEVDLQGRLAAYWPPGIQIDVHGVPGQGRLSIGYGIELVVQARFDVEVAGIRYDWEGDIPVPFIPEDLRMADEVVFDPFLLPDDPDRPARATDATDDVRIVGLDAIDSIVDIPGVGGGLQITLRGELAAAYETDRVVIDGADPIEAEGGGTFLAPPGEGFGEAVQLVVHPEGTVSYDGQIVVVPSFYIEVLGTRFDLGLIELPIPLPGSDSNVVFDALDIEIPVPDLETESAQLDFGEVPLGETATIALPVTNAGRLDLHIEAEPPEAPFGLERSDEIVPAGEEGHLNVSFTPSELGDAAAMFFVTTNDPDEPSVGFMLLGQGVEPLPEEADGGLEEDAPGNTGCGCSASGPAAARGSLALLVLVLPILRRRP